jgi:hypothetical protein
LHIGHLPTFSPQPPEHNCTALAGIAALGVAFAFETANNAEYASDDITTL